MVNKVIWTIIVILLLFAFFAGAYYITSDKISNDPKDNFVTGNIIYTGVEPQIIEPIKAKSIYIK